MTWSASSLRSSGPGPGLPPIRSGRVPTVGRCHTSP
jgi:hypothetical protein